MLPVVVSAVKLTAGYNDETHTFGAPSLALKLTHTIKRCAEMLETDAIVDRNSEKQKDATNFNELCKRQFSTRIFTHALQTLNERKFNYIQLLPLTSELPKRQQLRHDSELLT